MLLRAQRGVEGIELARRARPDLVLLDLVMPDLTGFDVLAALKDDPDTRSLPVLVMTAEELGDGERERLCGRAEAILQKCDGGSAELLSHLRRLRERQAAVAAGPARP